MKRLRVSLLISLLVVQSAFAADYLRGVAPLVECQCDVFHGAIKR